MVLTDIYAASEDPIPGVTIDALAAAINTSRATPVRVVEHARRGRAGAGRAGAPGDLVITLGAGSIGGVASRVVARARAPAAARRACADAAVAAPADKRFRRAHVKPARKRKVSAWHDAGASRRLAAVLGVALYGGWRGTALSSGAPALQVSRVTVRGNERLSTGEVLAIVDGLRGRNILTVELDEWQQRLLASPWVEDATLRRMLPSRIDVAIRERRPIGIARLGRRSTWSTRAASSSTSTDRTTPSSTCRSSTAWRDAVGRAPAPSTTSRAAWRRA